MDLVQKDNNAGPGCINGPCPEGNMTCGNIVKVRERFRGL